MKVKNTIAWTSLFGFIAAAAFSVSGSMAAPDDGAEPSLKLEAKAFLFEREGEKGLRIIADLINPSGDPKTVITDFHSPSVLSDAHGIQIGFNLSHRYKSDRYTYHESIYPYAPLTLRAGEATRLGATVTSDSIADLSPGDSIRVSYFIHEHWSERFDLWPGWVHTEVEVIDSATVVSE